MGFFNMLATIMPVFADASQTGLIAIGAAIAVCCGTFSAVGEALVCCHAIDGMVRNPEQAGKLRSTMILAVALCESTAIYAFVTAILILFTL
jgi:F-type H+-transporting ATPase subunit c